MRHIASLEKTRSACTVVWIVFFPDRRNGFRRHPAIVFLREMTYDF